MATKTLLSIEDFQRLPDDGALYELNEGELVTVTRPTARHTLVALRVQQSLAGYAQDRKLGEVLPEAAFLISREPPSVRAPDVSFVSRARIAETNLDAWFEGAPELAVEVVSPSESAEDLETKVVQYLAADARAVWVIYPKTRTVHVHESGGAVRVLAAGDVLESPELFPGWAVNVSELFV